MNFRNLSLSARLVLSCLGWLAACSADAPAPPGTPVGTSAGTGGRAGQVGAAGASTAGAGGANFIGGVNLSQKGLTAGRLYFAVNDNKHWQNNLGSFWVELRVSDAYDLGDAQ